MKRPLAIALLGALALGAAPLVAEPAAALPVSGLSSTVDGGIAVKNIRYVHRAYRRGFGFRRGYGYRRPYGYGYGYRRPGPVRRLLNHL